LPVGQAESDHGPCSTSVLVILYHVLRDKKPYTGLEADYFDKLDNIYRTGISENFC
jgi:hypothetical protein